MVSDHILISSSLLPGVQAAGLAPRRLHIVTSDRSSIIFTLLLVGVELNPGPSRFSNSSKLGIRGGLLNIRSAVNKAAVLHDLIATENLDFIALTETWFRENDPPAVKEDIAPDGFSTFHGYRKVSSKGRGKGRGGGVSLVVRNTIHAQILPTSFTPKTFEILTVKLKGENGWVNFTILYRPPPAASQEFFDEFNSLCETLESVTGTHYILGDFNCPGSTGSIDQRLSDIICDRNYQQMVNSPTRTNNLLDLIISFEPTSSQSFNSFSTQMNSLSKPYLAISHLVNICFSDHRLIVFNIKFSFPNPKVVVSTYRNLRTLDVTVYRVDQKLKHFYKSSR